MSFYSESKDYVKSFVELIYPLSCQACEVPLLENESHICVFCQHDLFITNQNLKKENLLLSHFSEQPVEEKAALMRYQKQGYSQELINKIKYQAEKSLGFFLGQQLGHIVKTTTKIKDIDCIIPVPLHKNKLKSRGFNQADLIAQGISDVIGKPLLNNVLIKSTDNSSQTKKKRLNRWKNTETAYKLNVEQLNIKGKNILLVDDVMTSGATLTSCCKQLHAAGVNKKYIAVLAIAGR